MTKAQHIGTRTGVLQQSDNALYCRLVGKLSDGTVFADHQADDNLLQLVVGEGDPQANPCRVVISVACGFRRHNVHAADNDKKISAFERCAISVDLVATYRPWACVWL